MTSAADIERTLSAGRELKAWWAGVESGSAAVDRFELVPAFPGGDAVIGFFGEAPAGGRMVPVMGCVGDYFFDLAGASSDPAKTAAWMTAQAEEFALGYWLRTEACAIPQPYPNLDRLEPPRFLNFLSAAPPPNPQLSGMANLQRAYKLRETGQTGEFPEADARAIIDLRELETRYEWITLERLLLDLGITLAAGGANSASLTIPMPTARQLVLSSDLCVRQRQPCDGVIGEFGVGFAPMPVPGDGPVIRAMNSIHPGLRLQTLRVRHTAEVRLRTVTILARPDTALKALINPVAWGLGLADKVTAGISARLMPGTASDQVERYLLSAHAIRLRDSLLGTRAAWQEVRDWLDPAGIPEWIRKGGIV